MMPMGAGIVYLLKDRFQIYLNALPDILEFRFSSATIDNLVITNKNLLIKEITEFISENHLPPSDLVFVIADNAAYSKELLPTEIAMTQTALQEQIKPFVEKHPAAQAVGKTLTTPTGIKIFATNQEFYLTIKDAFESKKFSVEYIFPGCIFSNNIGMHPNLSVEIAGVIFNEALSKKEYALLVPQESKEEILADKTQQKKDAMRLYAMINVFSVLIIAVIVTWHITHPTPSQDYRGKAAPQQAISPSQAINVAQETQQLTVKITYGATTAHKAVGLKKLLEQFQFKQIIMKDTAITMQTKNMILFSNKPSDSLREYVLTKVKKTIPDITEYQTKETDADIIIILGN